MTLMKNFMIFKLGPGAIIQFQNHAQSLKVKNSGGPLNKQTWQTEWKTAPLAKVQLCEYENQTLEALVAASRLSKLIVQWPARICSLLAIVHDCETGFFRMPALLHFLYSCVIVTTEAWLVLIVFSSDKQSCLVVFFYDDHVHSRVQQFMDELRAKVTNLFKM